MRNATVDIAEVERFSAQADNWWDSGGSFSALHRLNPIRLGFIRSRLLRHFGRDAGLLQPFGGLSLLDIGCGGGLVAEPMARIGFAVTGIDASIEGINVACEHALAAGLDIDYRLATAELIASSGRCFDVVLALEVIEHLTNRANFWRSVGKLVRPGGAFIAATINRTAGSFALAIVGAEYVLGWLPRGTHDWRKLVPPSELILGLQRNGLRSSEIVGLNYDPPSGEWALSRNIDVNYFVMAVRP